MNNTAITVLMPVYNGEKYLKEAISSVLCQTFRDFEFLIVNDGSTDKSEEIIRSYRDPRIKLINQPNGGVSKALNLGLQHASSEYIARIDADDISYPNRLRIQYEYIKQHPETIAVGSDVDYITEEGEFIFRFINPAYTNQEIHDSILYHCPFVHSSVLFVKQAALDLGGYSEKAHSFEDHLLWSLLLKKGKLCNIPEVLGAYRFNISSVTIDNKDYDEIFLKIRRNALMSGGVSDLQEELLKNSLQKLDRKKKEISYNRMLGKKFLWNNYQPKKARNYLRKSIKAEPFNKTSYFLYLLSFLPKGIINKIYTEFKRTESINL